MLRFDRVGIVACVVGIAALGLGPHAAARDATRDYPHSQHCPIHTPGLALDGDPYLFKANRSNVRLTFVTCDGRAANIPNPTEASEYPWRGYALDVSIDDLMVVDRAVFNAEKNRVSFSKAAKLFGYDPTCYGSGGTLVDTVFDKSKRFKKSAVPFLEDFEGSARGWLLGNATFAKEQGDSGQSLILSRSSRTATSEGSCSVASVNVDGLVPGREYVVDFSWWVKGFEVAGFPDTYPPVALSFFVGDVH